MKKVITDGGAKQLIF